MRIYFEKRENFRKGSLSGTLVSVGIVSFYLNRDAYQSIEEGLYTEINTAARAVLNPVGPDQRSFKNKSDFRDAEHKILDLIDFSNARERAWAATVVIDGKRGGYRSFYDLTAEVYAHI